MALTLSLRVGESVLVGEGIVIKILQHEKGAARLNFDAPEDIEIRLVDRKTGLPKLKKPRAALPAQVPAKPFIPH